MRPRAAVGLGAALAAWVAVLVSMNAAVVPAACVAAFASLTLLAWVNDLRRTIWIAIVVGGSLLLIVPGVSVAGGSLDVVFVHGNLPQDGAEWIAVIAGALRVPVQVLGVTFLLLVPARMLLASAARVSPGTALLGALAARMQPLLGRDVQQVRDVLASRGMRMGRGAPIGDRIRSSMAIWEAMIAGMLDRAFVTAAALDVRGWAAARTTSCELRHPLLRDEAVHDARIDALLATCAAAAVAVTVLLRGGVIANDLGSMLLAVLLGALGLVPLAARSSVRGSVTPEHSDDAVDHRASTGAVLELDHVSMQYPGARAASLMDACLRVEPSELVVLVGPSGGGKSTLLDVVSGVAPRTTGGVRSGTVRLGRHVLDGTHRTPDHRRVAAVFQLPESQVLVGRVAEEIAFGPRHAGLPREHVEQRVLQALDQLDVRHLASRDCATLSGGELQRVLLAAALALDPDVLALDEPTSQLDRAAEERFWSVVDRVRRERGIGVLVAEHRIDALLVRSDAVVVVADGRVGERMTPACAAKQLGGSDPYEGLAASPVATNVTSARLTLRCDRLEAGGRTLLRNLAVALPPGSIVTLEGPNGTGKSTLLRAIRGLHPGVHASIDGRMRDDVGSSARVIAWQAQAAGAVLPGRTVLDAAAETSRRFGMGDAHVVEWLRAAGLGDRLTAHPTELSVGERQRLALAASTVHRPLIWLLDEPTRGMDREARRWVACHVLAHAAAGGVVVVATHDAQLAAAIATHRLRLDVRTGPSLIGVMRRPDGSPVPASVLGVDPHVEVEP